MKRQYRLAFVVCIAAILVACDRDGDKDRSNGTGALTVPPAPVPNLNYAIKELQFLWPSIKSATYYQLLENPDGASGYSVVKTSITETSVKHTIALHRRLNASYVIEACNALGCTGSEPVFVSSNLLPAIGYLKASNTGAGDEFGNALALAASGNTLVIGAYAESSGSDGVAGNQFDNSKRNAGAVYVFSRDGGVWIQQAYLKASNPDAEDEFGASLAISADGNTLAVGAYAEASAATGINSFQSDNTQSNAGAVYVFTRQSNIWSQQAYIKASNTGSDWFGGSVALSHDGNTLAVGASGEDSNSVGIDGDQTNDNALGAGAVYVFERTNGNWTQQSYIKASNTNAGDQFGWAVAVAGDGHTIAVGAPHEDGAAAGINTDGSDNSAESSGAVYVFVRSKNSWTQNAYIKTSNVDPGDVFGSAVALSTDGMVLAVGAPFERSAAAGINGDQTNNTVSNAGASYIFSRENGSWTQQCYVKATNTKKDNFFGLSVSISGDGSTLAVSSNGDDSGAKGIGGDQNDTSGTNGAGAAHVYERIAGSWIHRAYVKASNTAPSDNFGFRLSLSEYGDTLAVGASGESSNSVGVGGSQQDNSAFRSGAVYLY